MTVITVKVHVCINSFVKCACLTFKLCLITKCIKVIKPFHDKENDVVSCQKW